MYVVILAGGSGTRQRPLIGAGNPLMFERNGVGAGADAGPTMLERTLARVAPLADPFDVVVVTDRRHGQAVRELAPDALILPEPMNRNTAASIALATVAVNRPDRETMLVLSADHDLDRPEVFVDAVETLDREISRGVPGITRPLVTFGIRPTDGDPEFSYIRPRYGDVIRAGSLRVFPADGYEAGPSAPRARELFDSGTAFWNAGIYLWQRGAIREAIERYTPLMTLIEPAWRSELALGNAYDRLQALSIDEAVLSGAAADGALMMTPLEAGWHEAGRPHEEAHGTLADPPGRSNATPRSRNEM
jgi:mannose-1-phosphate guanylyltransferase